MGGAVNWVAKIEKNNRKKARERRKSLGLEKEGREGLEKVRPEGWGRSSGQGQRVGIGCQRAGHEVGSQVAVFSGENKKGPLWKQKAV